LGTEEDPFVISNWRITTDNETAISLVDTTAHVVIEDLVLSEDVGPKAPAIGLSNAENVTIRNVEVAPG